MSTGFLFLLSLHGQWHSLSSFLAWYFSEAIPTISALLRKNTCSATGRLKEAGGDEQQQDNLGKGCWFSAAASILSFQVLFRCVYISRCISKQKYKLALTKTMPSILTELQIL